MFNARVYSGLGVPAHQVLSYAYLVTWYLVRTRYDAYIQAHGADTEASERIIPYQYTIAWRAQQWLLYTRVPVALLRDWPTRSNSWRLDSFNNLLSEVILGSHTGFVGCERREPRPAPHRPAWLECIQFTVKSRAIIINS